MAIVAGPPSFPATIWEREGSGLAQPAPFFVAEECCERTSSSNGPRRTRNRRPMRIAGISPALAALLVTLTLRPRRCAASSMVKVSRAAPGTSTSGTDVEPTRSALECGIGLGS